MPATFAFRAATSSDVEAILVLSEDVYDGFDYLPHCLDHWLNMDPVKRINLVLHDSNSGEIVGFQSFR